MQSRSTVSLFALVRRLALQDGVGKHAPGDACSLRHSMQSQHCL